MNGRQSTIVTMFTVVLLTMTFIPISSQQAGTYDPWADINEDGKIDIWDLAYTAKAYGTTGDPTKNVNVTNFPVDEQGNLRVSLTEKQLSTYEDSVKIELASYSENDWFYIYAVTEFPFSFSPRGAIANVTALWLSFTIKASQFSNGEYSYKVAINQHTPTNIGFYLNLPPVYHAADIGSSQSQALVSGVNVLRISDIHNPPYEAWWQITGVSLFIEYEYQA